MLAKEGEKVGYGKKEENKENVDWYGFFILECGHKTDIACSTLRLILTLL